jgi:hypothetical protein
MVIMQSLTLFNASQKASEKRWQVVDDRVMGGRSRGEITYAKNGNLKYSGHVTTENNGGFSSVQQRLSTAVEIGKSQKVVLKVKGNSKRFQFRLKAEANQRHSHIHYFETTGEWQEIELPLEDFYATFRGRKLDLPNFEAAQVAEITFLIANYKEQDFELEVEWVKLR